MCATPYTNEGFVNAAMHRRFVTFYFTNFPPHLSNFYLRKGLEVCGMLEEVVVPNRCNVYGERYGFVRYSNVRDVGKLLKAVNAVCFGNFHIKAKVANFDKAATRMVENELNGSRGVGEVRVGDPLEKSVEDLGGGKEGKTQAGCVGTEGV